MNDTVKNSFKDRFVAPFLGRLKFKMAAKKTEVTDKKLDYFWRESQAEDVAKPKSLFKSMAKMGTQDQIVFAKRLAILIKSGVSIITALDILKKQASSRGSRQIIGYLRGSIEKGQSLAKAMENCKNVFGHFGVSIILVGETSGTLVQNLHYLADELKKKQELRRAIVGALIYPSFIVAATIGIVILLTAYVFPKILPVFVSFKAQLPWSTQVLVAVSLAMQAYWLYFLCGAIILSIGWGLMLRIESVRFGWERFLLRIPLLGGMFRSYYIANFSRTFSLLLKSEIGIIQALNIVGDTVGNAAYKAAFTHMAESIARGESLGENMEKDRLLFPPLVSQMVGVGEMTGNLGSSLMYLSEMYEDEMNNSTKNLATSIEPALMIFMGILVGFIALSIITPIYGITQSLHN
ncbi:MAG: type II secretion system F family protein [Candidatus Pacebacteria bacterium]|nr:type II secretion system F family protein [Candidatus Paceibacterota bacterium]